MQQQPSHGAPQQPHLPASPGGAAGGRAMSSGQRAERWVLPSHSHAAVPAMSSNQSSAALDRPLAMVYTFSAPQAAGARCCKRMTPQASGSCRRSCAPTRCPLSAARRGAGAPSVWLGCRPPLMGLALLPQPGPLPPAVAPFRSIASPVEIHGRHLPGAHRPQEVWHVLSSYAS